MMNYKIRFKYLLVTLLLSCLTVVYAHAQDTIIGNKSNFEGISSEDQTKILKYTDAVNQYRKANDLKEVSKYLNAIANVYWTAKQYDQAQSYYDKSLEVNQQLNNQNAIAGIHNFKGMIYSDAKEYEKSIASFAKAVKYYDKKRMKKDAINARINTSLAYSNLKQYDQTIKELEHAFLLAQEMNDLEQIVHCAGLLSKAYEDVGNTEQSHFYFNIYKAFHEAKEREKQQKLEKSLREVQLQRQLTEAEKKAKELELYKKQQELQSKDKIIIEIDSSYNDLLEKYSKEHLIKELFEETTQKQKVIIEQKEKILQDEKQLRWAITFALAILLALLFVVVYFYRRSRILNKRLETAYGELQNKNELLEMQKEEILQHKEEIEAQRDEIESQRDHVTTQRDQIYHQKKQITDSIQYAKRIQQAVLPPHPAMSKAFSDAFVLFMPRDIVSGDFYWLTQINGKIIVAAADCTGHGVPGAFMSMLGISFLNEIVNKNSITQPAEILNNLRERVKAALRQTGSTDEAKDGIDMSLITIDKQNMTMEFAGAYNPLYVLRDNEIHVTRGDKMPIGIHFKEKSSFSNHQISIKENDNIFLFSDGFVDQIGGPKGRKFMVSNFKELLLANSDKSMQQQHEIYSQTITNWMRTSDKKYQQVDDIVLLGIRI